MGAHHPLRLSDGETQALCQCARSSSWWGAELRFELGLPHLSPAAAHAVALPLPPTFLFADCFSWTLQAAVSTWDQCTKALAYLRPTRHQIKP